MGFINNISRGGTAGANSIVTKRENEIEVDVGVVETKLNGLPFDRTGVKVDKNFNLNNFVVDNVPTPTTSNHIANKGYVESWIKKDASGNIDAESKKIINLTGPVLGDPATVVANKGYVDVSVLNSQNFVINDTASKYLDKKTGGTMGGGINMDNRDLFGIQNPPKFGTSATSEDYVHSYIKKDGSGNINAENKKIINLALTPSADRDAVSFGFLNLYLPRLVYGDISSDCHMQTKRICHSAKPTASADATTKYYVDLGIINATQTSALGGIKKDTTNQFELNVPQAQRLAAPVLLNGSIIKDASGSMSVDVALKKNGGINEDVTGGLQLNVPEAKTLIAPILANGGIERDGAGKLKINVATAQKLIAPVLPTGGLERDSAGKIKLVDAVVRSLIMMDGNYHSWSKEFIKNNAAGHWLISDNSPLSSKVAKYGVLSGTHVESLLYKGFGERVDIVRYSNAERLTSGAGLINGRYNYATFDGVNDRIKCSMNLNITSGDKPCQ